MRLQFKSAFIMRLVFSVFYVVVIAILGALIGSFANVVIYRLPAGKSVVFPRSSCPNCGHKIRPWENIPIFSWLVLRGKCSSCKTPISVRYPLIEALTAAGFAALALRWPVETYGLTVLPLLAIFAMLVMMSFIDIDHFILPDSLTLPAVAIGLLGTQLYAPGSGLPGIWNALAGAALGAGIIVIINRVGSLVLRRFKDTKERLWPVGLDQVNIAAVAGALGGWLIGLSAAGASVLVNLVARRSIRLAEPMLYALWVVALLLTFTGLFAEDITGIFGSFAAAGAVAVLGALYWWLIEIFMPEIESPLEDDLDEPVAMGFGDVKLGAVLGAILGWQNLLVALFLSFILGAVGGLIGRALGGDRVIPFGPYLALGGVLALFFGRELVLWYLGLLGVF